MKFGIDYQAAVPQKRSGIGTYVFNLVKGLSRVDKINEYILWVRSQSTATPQLGINFIKHSKYNPYRWLDKLDVFHGPDFKLMSIRARKHIVTIHDLASYRNNDYMSADFQKLTKEKIEKSIQRSEIIVTISQTVKAEIEEHFPDTRGRIEVVYHGISDDIQYISEATTIHDTLRKYKLRQPYLLFVGNIEQRKNISLLLQAYRLLLDERRISHDLILVGRPGWGFEKIEHVRRGLKFGDRVRTLGWVDDGDLPAIYSAADVFVYPSLYEGFGFPILEAMKCRLPVVASDIPTHKEIASDSAVFVSPHNPADIASGVHLLITDRSRRNQLIKGGVEHVKLFQWDRCALQMVKIYSS